MTYEQATKRIKRLIFTIALISCISVVIAATGGLTIAGAAIVTAFNSLLWLAAWIVWWFWG